MAIRKVIPRSLDSAAASTNLNFDAGTLYVDSTNNRVGIGQTSPTFPLHVYSANASTVSAVNIRATTAADSGKFLIGYGGTEIASLFGVWSGSAFSSGINGNYSPFVFQIGGVEAMRFDPSKNLLLNTTMSAEAKFTVDGSGENTALFRNSNGTNALIRFRDNNTTTDPYISSYGNAIAFGKYGSGETMRIDSSGNVLVGITSNPSSLYKIVAAGTDNNNLIGSYNTATGNAGIRIQANQAGLYLQGSGTVDPLYITNTSATGYISFRSSADTERMRLDSGGNLFVTGGYIPGNSSRLVVRGFSPGSYNNTFSQANATVQIISNEMNNDAWNPTLNIAMVRQSLTTGANSLGGIGFSTIDDSNNGGMYDAGRIAIVNEQSSAVASPASMAFYTQVGSATATNAATERMRIRGDGNVVVGGTSAYNSAKLSVVGDLEARGNIKTQYGTMGAVSANASQNILVVPAGSYGASFSGILNITARIDGVGALGQGIYLIVGWGGGQVGVTPLTAMYGAGVSWTINNTNAQGGGGANIIFVNGGTALTSLSYTWLALTGGANGAF